MTDLLKERRASAKQRLEGLVKQLGEAEALVRDKACVYVTGSFGRGEASPYSDLDLFIVGLSLPAPGGEKQAESRALSRLDEVCVTADLIRQTREQKFPEFSVGGEYLAHHTAQELIGKLGTPEDDVLNTFTARLLLLLESKSLLGESVHAEVIRAAIGAYWRDYDGHESHFAPGFLANDILRLWRTFCVNYEARTQSEPAEKKAKRKLKNYKLKHSRLLTCYSALLYLLAVFTVKGTVSQESAVEMSALTPTERLERLPSLVESANPQNVGRIIACYEKFLRETDAPESEMLVRFQDPERIRTYAIDARAMGDAVHELLRDVGNDSPFYRMLVV